MKQTLFFLSLTLVLVGSCKKQKTIKETLSNNDEQAVEQFIKSSDIRVRDPFILTDESTQTYYLYASKLNRTQDNSKGQGVEVYTSKDLQNWTLPEPVFDVPEDFWATKWVWAPEVHKYKSKYYLFATFTSNNLLDNPPVSLPTINWPPYFKRGSQILVSDSPKGPFKPFKNGPHTPIEWMTLDGTLWEEDGQPYMIYCHEWVEIKDGTMDLIALKDDLSETKGENQVLFRASEGPWVTSVPDSDKKGFVTDGCFMYKTKTGKLLMIWSSYSNGSYSIGVVESISGSVKGPWEHQPNRIFEADGGHGMIFKTLKGQLIIALHQPNTSPDERMQLYKLKDEGEYLSLDRKLF